MCNQYSGVVASGAQKDIPRMKKISYSQCQTSWSWLKTRGERVPAPAPAPQTCCCCLRAITCSCHASSFRSITTDIPVSFSRPRTGLAGSQLSKVCIVWPVTPVPDRRHGKLVSTMTMAPILPVVVTCKRGRRRVPRRFSENPRVDTRSIYLMHLRPSFSVGLLDASLLNS